MQIVYPFDRINLYHQLLHPFLLVVCMLFSCTELRAQTTDSNTHKWFNFHAQGTMIHQFKPSFAAPYSGENSFLSKKENATSFTSTFYVGAKLNASTFFFVNPEVAGGSGLSKVLGMGSNPNGETFRVGTTDPKLYIARLFIKKIFAISNDKQKTVVEEGFNQFAVSIPQKYIAVILGKVSIADYFDQNTYSHDPRTQFISWGLMSNGAWDYPANTRGYTPSAIVEYMTPGYEWRFAYSLVPTKANGGTMDWHLLQAGALTAEFTKKYTVNTRPGTYRILGFFNAALMGNYQESIDLAKRLSNGTIVQPALENTASYKNHKFGFAFNIEQELFSNTGGFFRIGWNNGKSATWMFTEIDNSASIGVVINSKKWHRANDKLGIAYAISGLSRQHQDYFKAGGLGFALGDGKLNYTDERMLEAYYLYTIVPQHISLSGFYQLASNPGYNRDRKGPVNIFSLRLHVAM